MSAAALQRGWMAFMRRMQPFVAIVRGVLNITVISALDGDRDTPTIKREFSLELGVESPLRELCEGGPVHELDLFHRSASSLYGNCRFLIAGVIRFLYFPYNALSMPRVTA